MDAEPCGKLDFIYVTVTVVFYFHECFLCRSGDGGCIGEQEPDTRACR